MSELGEHLERLKKVVDAAAPNIEDVAQTRILTDSEMDALSESFKARARGKEIIEKHGKSGAFKILGACAERAKKIAEGLPNGAADHDSA